MSKFFYDPVVGIDVSADFSVVAILSPNGDIYRKPFRINHDRKGIDYLADQIKKVEDEFGMKTAIFMESTGVYHLTLFNFLKNRFNTFVFNPLITNSNKNSGIRKVKSDKNDAISIAKIGKFQDIKYSSEFDVDIFSIKCLCREYYKLIDTRSVFKKKLSADIRVVFPGYNSVFSDIGSKTSLAVLKEFSNPKAILHADKEYLIDLISKASRRSLKASEIKYQKLIKVCNDALYLGISSKGLIAKLISTINLIELLDNQIQNIRSEIESLIVKDEDTGKVVEEKNTVETFADNVKLLETIPGIGRASALTIMSEIGDINKFHKPKQLVAYFGVDPSVNQSGKFESDRNKMSKRGTSIGRRVIYHAALVAIGKNKSGEPNNYVLREYYKENLKGKKKKQGIGAIMNKIIKYIFSVLKNQKPFEVRNPKVHERMYLQNHSTLAA